SRCQREFDIARENGRNSPIRHRIDHMDLDVGVAFAEPGKSDRHDRRRGGRQRRHAKAPPVESAFIGQLENELFDIVQRMAGGVEETFALRRKRYTSGRALEQAEPKPLLEKADAQTYRRLRKVKMACGRVETLPFRHGDESFQLTKRYIDHKSKSIDQMSSDRKSVV